jgi:DNA primase
MISQNTIQQILGRLDIVDVVGNFVRLKKEAPITLASVPFIMKKLHRLPCPPPKRSINVLVAEEAAIPSVF